MKDAPLFLVLKCSWFWCETWQIFSSRQFGDGNEAWNNQTKNCRGLGSQTVTAETRNWTEHKRYAPRYVRT